MNANIVKKYYQPHELEPLTGEEQSDLSQAILGHGNLVKAARFLELNEYTIRRASNGWRLNPDTRRKIRRYLKKVKSKS